MKINDVVNEAFSDLPGAKPVAGAKVAPQAPLQSVPGKTSPVQVPAKGGLGTMGKIGKGILGVASALGNQTANRALRGISGMQQTQQASQQAAYDDAKFLSLVNTLKSRAERQGNTITMSDLGRMVPQTGQWSQPDARRAMLTRLADTLAQQYNITVTGRKAPVNIQPAAQPQAAAPTTPAQAPTTTTPKFSNPQQVVDSMIKSLPPDWLPAITAELLKRQKVGATPK